MVRANAACEWWVNRIYPPINAQKKNKTKTTAQEKHNESKSMDTGFGDRRVGQSASVSSSGRETQRGHDRSVFHHHQRLRRYLGPMGYWHWQCLRPRVRL